MNMAKKKRQVLPNHEKSTRENTAKEQPYLMPGTAEYEEYQSDLKMHDPFRPDDSFHDNLEKVNENHTDAIEQRNDASDGVDTSIGKRSYSKRIMKEVQFSRLKSDAAALADKTETPEDDKKVARAGPDFVEDLVYDDGVTQDEFEPKALSKFGF